MTAQAKPVRACVKVRVHAIMATEEAMPGGQAYMVWLSRNGKARGTQLVWATPGRATFDESVSVRCTLYRSKAGNFLSKEFELQVLHNETNYEAPGQIFGKAVLDLSCGLGRQQITLMDCVDPDATIDISVDVEILEVPSSSSQPVHSGASPKTPKKQSQVSKLIKRSSQKLKRAKKGNAEENEDEGGEQLAEEAKGCEASDEAEETKQHGKDSEERARSGGGRPAGPIMITPKKQTITADHVENNEDEIVGEAVPSRADRFLESSPKKVPLQESEQTVNQSNIDVAEAKDSQGEASDAAPTTKPTATASIERPPVPIKDAWA